MTKRTKPVLVSITINGNETISEQVDIVTANAVIDLVCERLYGPEQKPRKTRPKRKPS